MMQTIEYFLKGDKSETFPQSRTMDAHNKGKRNLLFLEARASSSHGLHPAGGHNRRLASYIAENIRSNGTLESYVYATQFIQAEALSTAFSSWRRLFKGGLDQAYCSGALVWQLNDVVSFSNSLRIAELSSEFFAVAVHFLVDRRLLSSTKACRKC